MAKTYNELNEIVIKIQQKTKDETLVEGDVPTKEFGGNVEIVGDLTVNSKGHFYEGIETNGIKTNSLDMDDNTITKVAGVAFSDGTTQTTAASGGGTKYLHDIAISYTSDSTAIFRSLHIRVIDDNPTQYTLADFKTAYSGKSFNIDLQPMWYTVDNQKVIKGYIYTLYIQSNALKGEAYHATYSGTSNYGFTISNSATFDDKITEI